MPGKVVKERVFCTFAPINNHPMELNIKRSLVFFDLETTGLNITHDRILEISVLKLSVDGNKEQRTWLINPEMPIPAESTAIHGIGDADVAGKPTFRQLAPELLSFFGNADLAGYNILKFDVPMLVEEFLKADVDFDIRNRRMIDVMNIFMKMEPRTLKGAYRFFIGRDFDDAHTAAADTFATFEVLEAMLDRYNGVEYTDPKGNSSKPIVNEVASLSEFSAHHLNADLSGQIIFDDSHCEVFQFGKYKGCRVEDVFRKEPQYYDWMMRSDFPLYTKKVITAIKLRMGGKTIKL